MNPGGRGKGPRAGVARRADPVTQPAWGPDPVVDMPVSTTRVKGIHRQPRQVAKVGIAHVRPRAGPVLVLGVVVQQRADGDHGQTEHQVQGDEVGIELGVDDERAEERVAHDAQHQRGREPMRSRRRCSRRIAAIKVTPDDHDQRAGHHAVGVLDEGVDAHRAAHAALEAGGPVRAPKARARQADRRPAQDDDDHREKRGEREPAKRRSRDAAFHGANSPPSLGNWAVVD